MAVMEARLCKLAGLSLPLKHEAMNERWGRGGGAVLELEL